MTSSSIQPPTDYYVQLAIGLRLHSLDEGSGPTINWLHGSSPDASSVSNFMGNDREFVQTGIRNIATKTLHHIDLEGKSHEIVADSVALARWCAPDNRLAGGIPITNIGDGEQISYIEGAMRSVLLAGTAT